MSKIKSVIKGFTNKIPIDYLFAAACFAFFVASGFSMIFTDGYNSTDLAVTTGINITYFIVILAACLIGIVAVAYLLNKKCYIARGIIISLAFFGTVTMVFNSKNIYLIIGFLLIAFVTVHWCIKSNRIEIYKYDFSNKILIIAVSVLAVLVFAFMFVVSLFRYLSFNAHNFDFGIFATTFERMRTTGLPMITNERNVLMSHFGVHFSPFFYLLLPVYMIFPSPITILFLQDLFIVAGVIPLVLICRHFKLQNFFTLSISTAYLFFPGFVLGGMNDFHENAFLSFVILFLFYFMLKNKNILFFVFLVMLYSIKEDAVIYAITIGLFMLFYKRLYVKSIIVIVLSLGYYVFASSMVESLNMVNSGVMIDRFVNYMPGSERSLISALETCFFNFPYFIGQVLTSDKMLFLCWVFIPVAFMPFVSKRKSLLILLLPLLVINIMSNWQYQYDISFQYTFGTGALIIIASVFVLAEKKDKSRIMLSTLSIVMSIIVFFGAAYSRSQLISYYTSSPQMYTKWEEFIAELPKDEEYTATSRLIAHMYDIPTVYAFPNYYAEQAVTKYLLTVSSDGDSLNEFIENNDYEVVKSNSGITLYKCSKFD